MKRPFLIIGLLCILGLLVAGCLLLIKSAHHAFTDFSFGEDYTLDASKFDAKAMETVEQCSGLSLPAGARGLNMFYQGSGIDDAFVAKVQIPQQDVMAVAQQIEHLAGTSAAASESLTNSLTWWNPESMKIKIQRELRIDSDFLQVILGEENNAWFLLVKWIST